MAIFRGKHEHGTPKIRNSIYIGAMLFKKPHNFSITIFRGVKFTVIISKLIKPSNPQPQQLESLARGTPRGIMHTMLAVVRAASSSLMKREFVYKLRVI